MLWGFITALRAGRERRRRRRSSTGWSATPSHYYRDFVKPAKRYRPPDAGERAALDDLAATLEALPADADAEAIQTEVYEVGKRHGFANLRDWFRALYEILLGQARARAWARSSRSTARTETVALIRRVLAGEDLAVA